MKQRLVIALIAVTAILIFNNATSYAAADQSIVLSPYLTETKILPSDQSKVVSFNLTNNTTTTQSFALSALDFGSLNDTGGLLFAGESSGKLAHKYGLANWLQLPKDHVSIAAGQSMKLEATILNQSTLGPGGHYAAIIMTVDRPPNSADTTVTVQEKISALIFATKVGGEVYDMQLSRVSYDGTWQELPNIISLFFKNTGNVHIVPRGTVKLISPSGHVVSQGIINEASSYVLPESTRQLVVQTKAVSKYGWEPGRYSLRVTYRYDGRESFATKTSYLHYYNIRGLVFVLVIMLVAAFLGWKLLQKYRQKAVASKPAE